MAGTTQHSIHGFTLVELVLVILIISILSVIVAVQWPGLSVSIGGQAEQIASDLRYTQTLSMSRDQRYCFLISGNTYRIIASSTSGATTLAFGNTTVTLGTGLAFGTITPASMFVFDGQGAPYSSSSGSCTTANAAAATALTSAGSIIISGGGQTRTISITAETGRVSIQ
jgi:prepilin-type N-terminal cleavage/methylation domain-containing protein